MTFPLFYLAGIIILFYFIGGIPFAKIVVWQKLRKDITTIGSGNVGATNVKRALGLPYALLVFALDFLKGYLPVLALFLVTQQQYLSLFVGFAIALGHIYSPYIGFKGGKGASTLLGIFSAIYPWVFFVGVGIVGIGLKFSVKSVFTFLTLFALLSIFIVLYVLGIYHTYDILAVALAGVLIVFTHRSNIQRLIQGSEYKK